MAAPKGRPRIGEMAVAKGFCTAKDVEKALQIQSAEDLRGDKHRLLGIILIQEGLVSVDQLIQLLKVYEQGPVPG